jgi:predicted phosphodiesterase
MKYAIISDLHANLEAVEATFADIAQQGVDEILCLGDLVGYFANPNEVVSLIQSKNIRTITGNHDRVAARLKEPDHFGEAARRAILWTQTELAAENRLFLAALPLMLTVDDKLLVHGALTPQPNEDLHVSSVARAEQSLRALRDEHPARICLFGHTHRPMIYRLDGDAAVAQKGSGSFSLTGEARYLINPGSVGQSRDGDPRASYLILQGEHVQFRRVEFARAAALAKAERAGIIHRESLLKRTKGRIESLARHGREALRRILAGR